MYIVRRFQNSLILNKLLVPGTRVPARLLYFPVPPLQLLLPYFYFYLLLQYSYYSYSHLNSTWVSGTGTRVPSDLGIER